MTSIKKSFQRNAQGEEMFQLNLPRRDAELIYQRLRVVRNTDAQAESLCRMIELCLDLGLESERMDS